MTFRFWYGKAQLSSDGVVVSESLRFAVDGWRAKRVSAGTTHRSGLACTVVYSTDYPDAQPHKADAGEQLCANKYLLLQAPMINYPASLHYTVIGADGRSHTYIYDLLQKDHFAWQSHDAN